jgi:heme exporter protein D
MTHLPYIVAAYALGVVLPVTYAVAAVMRMRTAQRRLAAIDPRVSRPGAASRRRPP